jgi:predicted phage terminase large subunit-like protein
MTRWSPGDPVGRILAGPDAASWRVLHFPAIDDQGNALWPERYSREALDAIRQAIGSYDWESLYQGRPHARGGQYLKRAWFEIVDESDLPMSLIWFRGLDLAVSTKKTADYTASVRVAQHQEAGAEYYYVAGGFNQRLDWPDAKRKIVSLSTAEKSQLCVEAVAGFAVAHRELEQALAGVCVVRQVQATKDKLTRALPWIAAAEAGKIVLVRSARGSNDWIDEFLAQAEAFPAAGAHDDLIDALSIAFEHAARGFIHPTVWWPGKPDYDSARDLRKIDREIRELIDGCRNVDERREIIDELKRDGTWTPEEGWRRFDREALEVAGTD